MPPSKVVSVCNDIVEKRINRENMSREILLETIENDLLTKGVDMDELVAQLTTDI
jgi:hypothetical protein